MTSSTRKTASGGKAESAYASVNPLSRAAWVRRWIKWYAVLPEGDRAPARIENAGVMSNPPFGGQG
jgi:hypothetical protein